MKKNHLTIIVLISFLLLACNEFGQHAAAQRVSAQSFYEQVSGANHPQLIDVRTHEEFEGGHLTGAFNMDWKSDRFAEMSASLNKDETVFVYCLSGGRSSSAAEKLRKDGFKKVIELDGGILKWRAAGLPETKPEKETGKGMTADEFYRQLETDKKVLVDFYATWCAPCKRMEPFLEEIKNSHSENVVILRIDVDANPQLADELGVDALPTFFYYQNKNVLWRYTGFMTKEELEKKL